MGSAPAVESSGRLGRIDVQDGSRFLQAIHQRLEQWATELLDLVDEKSQHHQHGKHHREMLIAVSKVVLEMVALIFQGIERLIFDAPACSTTLHKTMNRALVDPQIGDPTEVLDLAFECFPTLK